FWRVDAYEPNRKLRLRAEMKLPGIAWLEFETEALPNGRARLTQTAFFEPRGLLGFLYWYGMTPFHAVLFDRMATAIATQAARRGGSAVFTTAGARFRNRRARWSRDR